ncbi:SusC/RagA family TonB-linked outer membrane protein [Arcticibacter sp. MXS-1]|uniref:SusC/RagA family TonB-linked outer membrane protein n=1 Tax=Arcticibacter sp. MXS-1 TaxID=3341726 RepID=UPI0035A92322
MNGVYALSGVPENATLVFTALGHQKQEIAVKGRTVINVSLLTDSKQLEEVMVVAYGTAKKGTYTGAASVVSQKAFKDAPVASFEAGLTGRVAGVQVTSSSGQAGSVPSIRIRGIGSMNAGNEPLYVIDGVPVVSGNVGQLKDNLYASNNVMSSINPSDIESITVLKDAAAASLYGSRAANGVVLVTTKRGKSGKPVINLKSSVGFTPSWATDNYEPAGIQEQTNMLYRVFHDLNTSAKKTDAVANSDALRRLNQRFNKHGYYFETAGTGLSENVIIKGMTDGVENREGKYFDWDDVLFRTGVYQTNDLSISGGDANTTYYSSLSYTTDKSRIQVNDFDRVTGRINLAQKVGKYVEFISNVGIGRTGQSGYNDTRNTGANYFLQSRNLLWPFYWPTDYKTGQPFTARYGSLAYNPEYYNNQWENNSITRRITANETLNIRLLPELLLKSVFSYDNSQVQDHLYYSALHFNGAGTNGSVSEITTNLNKIVSSTTLNYTKQFGAHQLNLLAGFEAERNKTDFQRSTGTDLASSSLHTVATAGTTSANAYSWGNTLVSGLSRAEYNYNQKYFASASYRRDGSSRLGPDARWGDFWSVAGAWTISRESFMEPLSYISNLRLRASYGTNGTLPTDNYGWRNLTFFDQKYMSKPGGLVKTISDPNLTWETNYASNFALEFGLFDQRITGSVEYFNRDSKNLLQSVPVSLVTGYPNTLRNVGEMNNRGLEIDLGGDIIRNKELRWSASINGTFMRSKVVKLYNGSDIIWYDPTGGEDRRAQFIYRENSSPLTFYGFEWAGVRETDGKNVWYVNDPNDPQAGDFLHNGRGATLSYAKANYTTLGSAIPDVYGGINTDLEYKGFTLALNFNYKLGGKLYDGAFKDVADDGYYWERIRAQYYYDNMWTPDNIKGSLPKLDGNDLTDPQQYSSRQMHDASFLRLKFVTLGYNLPSPLVKKVGASNIRVYLNGSNLLTFSKYKIADPEVNEFGTRGWETPFGKTYTMGIEVGF